MGQWFPALDDAYAGANETWGDLADGGVDRALLQNETFKSTFDLAWQYDEYEAGGVTFEDSTNVFGPSTWGEGSVADALVTTDDEGPFDSLGAKAWLYGALALVVLWALGPYAEVVSNVTD